jgi:hypothetical protein
MRGSASSSVTSVPKALKTSANSQPTAPAPTIAIAFGAFSRNSASVLEMTLIPSYVKPICGRSLAREPVATTIAFAAVSSTSPAVPPVTLTFFPGSSVAVPRISSILCFLRRNSTPLLFWSATRRERFIATP